MSTARIVHWDDVTEDHPIPFLTRNAIHAEQMLVARIFLQKGCRVEMHRHESEQTSILLSGKVRWFFGEPDAREEIVGPGQVVLLPSNCPHGVETLEDSLLIDILSPPGPMGVDSQG